MKMTIDKKVSMFISIMFIVFGTLTGMYIIRDETEHMRQVLDELASVLLSNLAINLEYPVIIRDTGAISRLVKGVMAQKDVVYCRVEDNDGTLLYEEGQRAVGPFSELSAPVVSKKVEGAEALVIPDPHEVIEEVGRVTLAVSLAELINKSLKLRITITVVILVGISIISLGTYLFLRRLVGRPVKQLVDATRRIAGGDLGHRVSLTTDDEFEILGGSFDHMTESLLDAQRELVRREKLAALGHLAGGVGNELRNPLGVMNNAVFFLRCTMSDTDERVVEYLNIIDDEIANAQRIISDFVDFFRSNKPDRKPVPVHEIIRRSVDLCAIPDLVTLRDDIPAELPPVNVDMTQMSQVLQNLIVNAVQVMPNGGSLRIDARRAQGTRLEAEGSSGQDIEISMDLVEISVSDTGTGISSENITKVFEPLYTTKSRGIGLGLAICRSYVEANGGRIQVESVLGEGTTFKVLLPV